MNLDLGCGVPVRGRGGVVAGLVPLPEHGGLRGGVAREVGLLVQVLHDAAQDVVVLQTHLLLELKLGEHPRTEMQIFIIIFKKSEIMEFAITTPCAFQYFRRISSNIIFCICID